MTQSKPTEFPPEQAVKMSEFQPKQVPPEEFTSKSDKANAPSLTPPEMTEGSADDGVTAWQNNRKINALWSINQNRNVWAHIVDIGWKKFADNSDSAIVAFSILAAHAKQQDVAVNFRDEADGKIYEIYVW